MSALVILILVLINSFAQILLKIGATAPTRTILLLESVFKPPVVTCFL